MSTLLGNRWRIFYKETVRSKNIHAYYSNMDTKEQALDDFRRLHKVVHFVSIMMDI